MILAALFKTLFDLDFGGPMALVFSPLFATTDYTTMFTAIFVGVTFIVYLAIGWYSRVAESKGFYVAGQGVPAVANGAATAADWMSAASFMGMAGLISRYGSDGSVFLMGWTGGYVLLALLLAPYLRKFGKYTVPDFVGERYYSEAARIVAAVCAIFVSLTYVAGQMRGVGIVFSRFLQVEVWQGVVVGMVIVAFFAVLGGMKGITWTQVVQYFVLIFAFLIPAFALSSKLTGNPIPQLGLLTSDIAAELNGVHERLGFSDYTQPFSSFSRLNVLCYTFALMAGTAGLPHVIVRFYTVGSVRAARFSAGWALLFIAILYTTAPALALFARNNMLASLDGATVEGVDIAVTENGETTTKHYEENAAEAVADARAAQAAHDPATGERSTEYHYHLTDADGKQIHWVDTWQKTGLVGFDDKDANGAIKLDAMVVAPAASEDSEAVLTKDLRYEQFRLLDGAEFGETKTVDGKEVTALRSSLAVDLPWAEQLQASGDLKVNDKNGDGKLQLGSEFARENRRTSGFSEARIDPDTIVLSTPEVAALPGWVIALVATGGLAAALSTAAGLLLVISSSMAHDLYIHFLEPKAPESRRLLVGRLMIIVAIVVAGYFGINPPDYVAATVAFAFGLAAASFFPVILLGIFDKRANREGAVAGMVVGITFTAVYIVGCKADAILGVFGVTEPFWGNWFFGILPEGIGTIGCLLNMAVMIIVSRLTSAPPAHVQKLVESVRTPAGAHEPEAHFDETDAEADNP